jgi:hypothetical protein
MEILEFHEYLGIFWRSYTDYGAVWGFLGAVILKIFIE